MSKTTMEKINDWHQKVEKAFERFVDLPPYSLETVERNVRMGNIFILIMYLIWFYFIVTYPLAQFFADTEKNLQQQEMNRK